MEENKNITQEQEIEENVVKEETVADADTKKRNKILLISTISAGVVVLALIVLLLIKGLPKIMGADKPLNQGGTESLVLSGESSTSDILNEESSWSGAQSGISGTNNSVGTNNSAGTNNSVGTGYPSNNTQGTQNTITSSSPQTQEPKNPNASATPTVTATHFVAPDICIVVGSCAKGTQSIVITGDKVQKTTVTPYAGEQMDYFITQLNCTGSGEIKVVAYEKGKEASKQATRYIFYEGVTENLMTRDEYRPVIGKNGFGHFYSALVGYSCSTAKLPSDFKDTARNNISDIVNAAKRVNAEPIFLIIPSSAEIYPETLPDGYSKTTGESLYKAFYDIATDLGATVIYPIDTMKAHKNDGVGYQLYQHTDSHWSTYGAYWGIYDLFIHISKNFPAAKPRTLSEMGFYTEEFYAGDNMFNLRLDPTKNNPTFKTTTTGMKELSTLYSFGTFENTLRGAYHNLGSPSLYLSEANSKARMTQNPQGAGLPNAVIMRDSFSKVAFDMVSDRFNKVYWQTFDDYTIPVNDLAIADADYLIYMYSERNLLKLMFNNSGATILELK